MKVRSLFLFFPAVLSIQSDAREIPWKETTFFITSQDTSLASVLRELGASAGIPVIISPSITDSFSGEIRYIPSGRALSELSSLYQLMPYYDGNTLYIYKSQEMSQTVLSPSSLNSGSLYQDIRQSGLVDGVACQVHRITDSGPLQISGVPACLQQISAIAGKLDERNLRQEQNDETVTVFPLRYASAADISYTYRNQDVIVPGVVSVLRNMVQGDKKTPNSNGGGLPAFSADQRQNAVLVHDTRRNLRLYKELIPQLDKRPSLIEISVTIIDVDAGDINELGIDWSATARIGGGRVSFNNGRLDSDSFSSLISNSGNFMIRLSALEQQSKAKIVSRPSVVTLENVQAVLDHSITFYTKLESEKNPKLESVTAGALMRVTPRLIKENNTSKVMLILNIEDGRQGQPVSSLESLPQIHNAEIATQATLNPGQALLLGGFIQNEHIKGVRKIPLLGDLPLVGGLFRTTTEKVHSVVRLFLITAESKELRGSNG